MLARRTPLYGIFTALGARMVERPGFFVPDFFTDAREEHLATRTAAGLFDIFGQFPIDVRGATAEAFLQRLIVADVSRLRPGRVVYCSILSPPGTIIDDVTVFRIDEGRFWIVPTPSRALILEAYLQGEAGLNGPNVVLLGYKYTSLSLQGPRSRDILGTLTDIDLGDDALPYFGFVRGAVAGVANVTVSRTGFTGERGYELFVPTEYVESLYLTILSAGRHHGLLSCGLAAMGSLRIEKKYVIFGRDIDETTTPVEAGLGWTIKPGKSSYVGMEVVATQLVEGTQRRLVLLSFDKQTAPPPPNQQVSVDDHVVGRVTTSGIGQTVDRTLALAMVNSDVAKDGVQVQLAAAPGHPRSIGIVYLKAIYDPDNRRLRG